MFTFRMSLRFFLLCFLGFRKKICLCLDLPNKSGHIGGNKKNRKPNLFLKQTFVKQKKIRFNWKFA